ncbi:hypothetical protein MNBD_GAMMA23-662 [hydrothermal vent metagenome]|uniref:Uncharacterized protein n=1 Tax=hydrothermal vent metagenome TaxID=652676 RepID=A0A3B1A1K7_9ZZZZ
MVMPVFAGWPNVLLPPQAKEKPPLAEKIFMNGVPLKVVNFSTRLTVRQVLGYYRSRWADGFVEDEYNGWQQISRLQGKYFVTVQAKPSELAEHDVATRGRINIMNLNEGDIRTTPNFPVLQGSAVINDVETVDKYNKARTLLIVNNYPAEKNAEYYQRYFKKEKWTQVTNKTVGDSAHVLVFKRDEDETSVVIRSSSGDSSILVNEVKKKSWFN